MVKAIWNNVVLAESDHTQTDDGRVYFPPESVNWDYLAKSPLRSVQFWKGTANFYDIRINGHVNHAAAWRFPKPWILARSLKDYVAFFNGVKIIYE